MTRVLLALLFCVAGMLHFLVPSIFVKIVPPVFGAPLFWVYLSGFFELTLGVALLLRRTRRAAVFGLVVLLVAVFPANVYMALNPELFESFSSGMLWARLPVQVVLIVLVLYCNDSKAAT